MGMRWLPTAGRRRGLSGRHRTLALVAAVAMCTAAMTACSDTPSPGDVIEAGSDAQQAMSELLSNAPQLKEQLENMDELIEKYDNSSADAAGGVGDGNAEGNGSQAEPDPAPADNGATNPDAPQNACDALFVFQMGQMALDGTQESIDRVFGAIEPFADELPPDLLADIATLRDAQEKAVGLDAAARLEIISTDAVAEARRGLSARSITVCAGQG